mmetsp:Transcript_13364/g.44635  ORF Transcript_13364/g.44635 Transcript_13364/m.44635 type:complete len:237 (-) Transcript_13364:415-1125(-)
MQPRKLAECTVQNSPAPNFESGCSSEKETGSPSGSLAAASQPAAASAFGSSSPSPASRASSVTPASQSPSKKASRGGERSRSRGSAPVGPAPPASAMSKDPTSSRLMSNRGTSRAGMSTSEAKGCTCSDVPMTSSRSHASKSAGTRRPNRSGSCSPKKTMSGLTSPPLSSLSASTASSPCQSASRSLSTPTAWRRRSEPPGRDADHACAASKLPWAATVSSGGTPAALSSESMFCV